MIKVIKPMTENDESDDADDDDDDRCSPMIQMLFAPSNDINENPPTQSNPWCISPNCNAKRRQKRKKKKVQM